MIIPMSIKMASFSQFGDWLSIWKYHICFNLALSIILSFYVSLFQLQGMRWNCNQGLRIEDWSGRWRGQHNETYTCPISLWVYSIYLCSSRHWQMHRWTEQKLIQGWTDALWKDCVFIKTAGLIPKYENKSECPKHVSPKKPQTFLHWH